MPKKKETTQDVVVNEPIKSIIESQAKQEFRKVMERYALSNPTKYAQKLEEFNKKLEQL